MTDQITAARLEIISAKAKILAESARNGSFWPGDLEKGIQEIRTELAQIPDAIDNFISRGCHPR